MSSLEHEGSHGEDWWQIWYVYDGKVGILMPFGYGWHIDGLVNERGNSIANTLELRLSCTHPSIYYSVYSRLPNWILLMPTTLRWRHNGCEGVSNHQPHDCLLNLLFRHRSKKTSKLRVTCLCAGNSRGTGEFPAQRASNTENVSIWWHHHECQ